MARASDAHVGDGQRPWSVRLAPMPRLSDAHTRTPSVHGEALKRPWKAAYTIAFLRNALEAVGSPAARQICTVQIQPL